MIGSGLIFNETGALYRIQNYSSGLKIFEKIRVLTIMMDILWKYSGIERW